MEMPIIDRCFGAIPPRHGCWLISVFGLGVGGLGIACIVIFSLVEGALTSHLTKKNSTGTMDASFKKLILMTMGLTSLLLLSANTSLFFGVTCSALSLVKGAKYMMFVMCMFLIIIQIWLPSYCFYEPDGCLVKEFSAPGTVIGNSFLSAFTMLWLYFMVVTYNFELEV